MIELDNLSYSYSKTGAPALCGLCASVEPGIHLLAGENGAGKTTLLHILAGTVNPTKGRVLIDGLPAGGDSPAILSRSFLLEEDTWFPGKTIREFAAIHSPFYPAFSPEEFDANLADFGMTGEEPLKSFSLGNRKKAQLAYTLALGADLLLLDEPTNALDIESKEILRKIIARTIYDGRTIIVSTHTVQELENLFDGAIMLHRSRLLTATTEDALTERLAFTVTRTPDPDALYSESQLGRALNIMEADAPAATRADWRLLYSALRSPSADRILQILNSKP